MLHARHHQLAVKASVELEFKEWIYGRGHIDFFCTNQKQVTFAPITDYQIDQERVILCHDEVPASECQRIRLSDIQKLFQLYFDRVTEETKQKFVVEEEDSLIVVNKVEPGKAEEVKFPVKKAKSPSKAPKTKAKAEKDLCDHCHPNSKATKD